MAKHNVEQWIKEQDVSCNGYVEEKLFIARQGIRQTKAIKAAKPILEFMCKVAGIEYGKLKIENEGAQDYHSEWIFIEIIEGLQFIVGIWSGGKEQEENQWEDTDNAGAIYYHFWHHGGEEVGYDGIEICENFDLNSCLLQFLEYWKECGGELDIERYMATMPLKSSAITTK